MIPGKGFQRIRKIKRETLGALRMLNCKTEMPLLANLFSNETDMHHPKSFLDNTGETT